MAQETQFRSCPLKWQRLELQHECVSRKRATSVWILPDQNPVICGNRLDMIRISANTSATWFILFFSSPTEWRMNTLKLLKYCTTWPHSTSPKHCNQSVFHHRPFRKMDKVTATWHHPSGLHTPVRKSRVWLYGQRHLELVQFSTVILMFGAIIQQFNSTLNKIQTYYIHNPPHRLTGCNRSINL